ncbi:MAG: CPBP family intramembrane metalloprotease [Bacteroidales bacterium]|nr:CPBP family intramembrane metalloprotease [Bacteroidales bacterium]
MAKRGNYKFLSKFSWYVPGVGGLFALLAWMLLGGLIGGLLTVLLGAVAGQEAILEYGTLISYPVMFVPPMLYAAVKSNNASMSQPGVKLDSDNYSPVGGLLCAILVSIGTLAVGFWAEPIGSLLPPMPEMLKEALGSLTNGNLVVDILCVSIMAPLCEEWLCRGMVLRGLLSHKMNPALAIIISALFFAVIHLNPWQAIPAFIIGCLLGYVYYKTGSLKLTMLMHCVNNTFAVICSRLPGMEEAEGWMDVIPSPAYWILVAASVLLTALVVLGISKVRQLRPEGNMDPVPSIFETNEA